VKVAVKQFRICTLRSTEHQLRIPYKEGIPKGKMAETQSKQAGGPSEVQLFTLGKKKGKQKARRFVTEDTCHGIRRGGV